ncbi:MAG: tRNA (adenosine(37)-N6)-threonylcarbamoyltransferase complex transferase subunit TsaD [Ignavibacteriales bacterium]
MNILGIETSCDETSVAIISDGKVKSNLISSQHFHKDFGGVVPELSSRAHLQMVLPLLKKSLSETKISKEEIDVVAVTAGPGLIGALLVGLSFAKSFSYSLSKTFIPVNHIEGHIYSGFLMDEKPEFPFLCLVVSGGHTLLLIVESETKIKLLGSTIDDAAGEAFDKVSKLIGLGYPGGPMIQKFAEKGNADAIKFPIAKLNSDYDFSFSGLKTSVIRHVDKNYENRNIHNEDLPDIAASFQKAIISALSRSVIIALNNFDVKSISVVGGVSANSSLRNTIEEIGKKRKIKTVFPSLEYCGDNGAMIANRGEMIYRSGKRFELNYNAFPSLDFSIFS